MKAKVLYQHILANVSQILQDEKEFQPTSSIIFRHFVDDEFALLLDKEIKPIDESFLNDIFQRLRHDEPIQYILQKTFFLNLPLYVDKNVLIPRPETEEIVLDVYKCLNKVKGKVLDIGTGSGCIALSLKKKFIDAQVDAIDINPKSLEVAKRNAKMNGLEVNFIEKDIFKTETLDENYDLIISNPPYICQSEKRGMSERVVEFEPSIALFVEDDDPLIFYKKIIALAKENLNEGGWLFVEINENFGEETARLMLGLQNVTINKDINGKDRWISARFLR